MESDWKFKEEFTVDQVNPHDRKKFKFKKPVVITVFWNEPGNYTAFHMESGEGSSGESKDQAIFNCICAITESFELLRAMPPFQLGPAMYKRQQVLCEYVGILL